MSEPCQVQHLMQTKTGFSREQEQLLSSLVMVLLVGWAGAVKVKVAPGHHLATFYFLHFQNWLSTF